MTRLMLGPLTDFVPDSAKKVEVDGHRIAVVRIGDDIYAIGDTCSHADFSLSEGELDTDDLTLECFKHGASFSLTDGEPQCLPATQPVPVYTTLVEDGVIYATPGATS